MIFSVAIYLPHWIASDGANRSAMVLLILGNMSHIDQAVLKPKVIQRLNSNGYR